MVKIKLLTDYQDNKAGEIISVSNNVAFGLVESKRATYALKTIETDFGETKAVDYSGSFRKNRRRR